MRGEHPVCGWRLAPVVVGASLVLALAACDGSHPAGPSGAPGGASTRAHIPLVGFNDNAVAQRLVSPSVDARLLSRVGANAVRVTLDWRTVEPSPGHYDFAFSDAVYRAMLARGVATLWIPMFAPAWARAPGCPSVGDCHAPPDRAHDDRWRALIARIVKRYPHSAGIEVWNEPNYVVFWTPRPDAARYTELLREAYHAAKAVDRSMPVVSGGFGDNPVAPGSANVSLADFTRAVFERGGGAYMDAIGFHPYPQGPDQGLLERSFAQVRSIRAAYGYPRMPLWVTETGVSTTGTVDELRVTPDRQASELVDIYRRVRAMSDVHAVFFHTLLEPRGPADDIEVGYGILHSDQTPKPAYSALARVLARR